MKWICLAVIVLGLMAGDFGATALRFSHSQQHNWAICDSMGIAFAAVCLAMAISKEIDKV